MKSLFSILLFASLWTQAVPIGYAAPSGLPSADIKARGSSGSSAQFSDGPIAIPYNTAATLQWKSKNVNTCRLNGVGVAKSGTKSTGKLTASKTFSLKCTGSKGSASDAVTVNVQAVNQAPIGSLEKAADEGDGDQSILRGGTLIAEGWAADNEDGAPVSKVEIFLNNAKVGNATLGISRSDVAQKNNRPDYTNSGFKFSYDTKNLQPGDYAVVGIAFDSKGASKNLGSKTISVVAKDWKAIGEQIVQGITDGRFTLEGAITFAQNAGLIVEVIGDIAQESTIVFKIPDTQEVLMHIVSQPKLEQNTTGGGGEKFCEFEGQWFRFIDGKVEGMVGSNHVVALGDNISGELRNLIGQAVSLGGAPFNNALGNIFIPTNDSVRGDVHVRCAIPGEFGPYTRGRALSFLERNYAVIIIDCSSQYTAQEWGAILQHELGHILGLGHVYGLTSFMNSCRNCGAPQTPVTIDPAMASALSKVLDPNHTYIAGNCKGLLEFNCDELHKMSSCCWSSGGSWNSDTETCTCPEGQIIDPSTGKCAPVVGGGGGGPRIPPPMFAPAPSGSCIEVVGGCWYPWADYGGGGGGGGGGGSGTCSNTCPANQRQQPYPDCRCTNVDTNLNPCPNTFCPPGQHPESNPCRCVPDG